MSNASLYLLMVLACSMIPNGDTYRQPFADPEIDGPGTPCPFPFDPIQLYGAPLGQYHCPYCGSMVIAGIPHLDYVENGA